MRHIWEPLLVLFVWLLAFAGFVFLFVFMAHSALGQTTDHLKADQCVTIERMLSVNESTAEKVGVPIKTRIFAYGQARRFMKAFNAMPPSSNLEADRVASIILPGNAPVFVFFERDRCITDRANIPVKAYLAILKRSSNELHNL